MFLPKVQKNLCFLLIGLVLTFSSPYTMIATFGAPFRVVLLIDEEDADEDVIVISARTDGERITYQEESKRDFGRKNAVKFKFTPITYFQTNSHFDVRAFQRIFFENPQAHLLDRITRLPFHPPNPIA